MIAIFSKGEVETRLEPILGEGRIGLVVPSLGGLPNQLGSGSETNNLDAGMCTRVVIVGIMKGGLMIFIHTDYSDMEDDCPLIFMREVSRTFITFRLLSRSACMRN